jgi:hypothetical protein
LARISAAWNSTLRNAETKLQRDAVRGCGFPHRAPGAGGGRHQQLVAAIGAETHRLQPARIGERRQTSCRERPRIDAEFGVQRRKPLADRGRCAHQPATRWAGQP